MPVTLPAAKGWMQPADLQWPPGVGAQPQVLGSVPVYERSGGHRG